MVCCTLTVECLSIKEVARYYEPKKEVSIISTALVVKGLVVKILVSFDKIADLVSSLAAVIGCKSILLSFLKKMFVYEQQIRYPILAHRS